MPAYQTRLQTRLQKAQDPEEKFRQDWEKRDIPRKPTRKGVWRLAKAGTRWKNISKNVADIPDMVVPVKWTPPLRVPQAHSNVTSAPAASSTTGVQPMMGTPSRHFLSALGLQPCSSTATCYPAESSSTVGLHSQCSVTGRPAEPSTTDLPSYSEILKIPRIEQSLQSPSTGRFETRRFEKMDATQGPMMEAPPRHFLSAIGLQSYSSTATCYPTESSSIGLHSQSSVIGRPAEPSTTDLPQDTWDYTIEGLRIPRIEQFLRSPSVGCNGAENLEEWGATQKPLIEVPRAPRHSSAHHSSTDVKALEQCTVKVPTNEPSAQCSLTEYSVTKLVSREIPTEVPSADVTKPEEGPSTSKPLGKRVREEDDPVLPMPPKKRYLINTYDGPSVKCVQTGIKRKAHDEAPSEELTNVATRRSSRKIKVPRRMDL